MKNILKQKAFHIKRVNAPYFIQFQGHLYLGYGHPTEIHMGASHDDFVSIEDLLNWNDFYSLEETPERLEFLKTNIVEENYLGMLYAMQYYSSVEEMVAYCNHIEELENTL